MQGYQVLNLSFLSLLADVLLLLAIHFDLRSWKRESREYGKRNILRLCSVPSIYPLIPPFYQCSVTVENPLRYGFSTKLTWIFFLCLKNFQPSGRECHFWQTAVSKILNETSKSESKGTLSSCFHILSGKEMIQNDGVRSSAKYCIPCDLRLRSRTLIHSLRPQS